MRIFLLALPFLIFSFAAHAGDAPQSHASKYAGQTERAIKSLSPDDIAELRRGGGWGLAKAAELNGVPGPAHLLELKDEIPLDPAQVLQINKVYRAMNAQAVQQGKLLIALEEKLEKHFRERTITDAILRASLTAIAETRQRLRYIHLSAHLKTPEILTRQQIDRYNALRGYGDTGPCGKVPKGHDAEMWRKHNGCG